MTLDFTDVRGRNETVRDVAKAAIAGRSILLEGPPGIGKTMIARRVPGLLGPLIGSQARWLGAEYDGAGLQAPASDRPFRAPHHSVSAAALAGARLQPGEVRLARFGVLFLDELPEFRRDCITYLRFALSLMGSTAPLVVASATRCPCGWRGSRSPARACSCSSVAVMVHQERLNNYCHALDIGAAVQLGAMLDQSPGPSTASLQTSFRQTGAQK